MLGQPGAKFDPEDARRLAEEGFTVILHKADKRLAQVLQLKVWEKTSCNY